MRLLLINPRFSESFWSFRWALQKTLPQKRAINPPLGLATVAALCPPHWQVEIIDENVEFIPENPQADIIGICGMAVQFPRQSELLRHYRSRGYFVVAGGSYASLCPERYAEVADTVIAGEAEGIWPAFCRDFEKGSPQALYQEKGWVDLTASPVPRFDLLKLELYTLASLQFSRGCPFLCEFCDIIVMFGRRPRTKTTEQIGRELDALRQAGVHNVFFVDDNLIGDKPKAKALLRFLKEYQRRHNGFFQFGTEASINLAEDTELLQLFREAGFVWVFVGIESPDPESLKEARKLQNTRQNLLAAVRRLYGHGLDVFGGFIVGFDNDTLATFDLQHRFIRDAGIVVAMVGLLTAMPRTPLFERLQREGRLLPSADDLDNTRPATNFVPKRMPYEAMVERYKQLARETSTPRAIAQRIRNKMRYLRDPSYQGDFSRKQSGIIVLKLIRHGLCTPLRLWHFGRTLLSSKPAGWPQVISDWITALAMRDYIDRYFGRNPRRERRVMNATLRFLRRTFSDSIRKGDLEVALAENVSMAQLDLTLRAPLHDHFYTRAGRRLEKLLHKTSATITLRIHEHSKRHQEVLEHLLQRLSGFGDRISVHAI